MGLEAGTPIEEIRLDRVFIGSCTNSRIGDLRAAAEVVKGRKVAADVYAMVVPGSVQVKRQAEAEGLDEVFSAAGFDWRGAGCSMCLGMNPDILEPGERCASTSNRNFEGRQGRGGRTHLVSPADGRRGGDRGPLRRHPELELSRWSRSTTIEGPVSVLVRDDVDTDQIIPKQFLKRVERTGFGEFLFYDWAKEPGLGPAAPTRSSSPGATSAAAPPASTRRGRCEDYGFRAIIAPSFADIFRSNCTKIGLLPVELAEPTTCRRSPRPASARGRPRGAGGALGDGDGRAFEIDPEIKHRLLNGLDDIALTLQQADAIDAYERERERPGPVTTAL